MTAEQKSYNCQEGTGMVYIKGHVVSEETRRKIGDANRGHKCSEEQKIKVSISLKGIKRSDEFCRTLSEANKGKKPSENTIRASILAHTGRPLSEEIKRKMSEAQRGERNHFFGKKHTEETKQKIGIASKNRTITEETRKKLSVALKGRPSPHKGHHHTEEARKKISEGNRGKIVTWGDRISLATSGENHFNWKGGVSFVPYCPKFNNKLKERIRERDNRTCQLCNTKENGQKLSVHHFHYDKENCYPDLISLCGKCNAKANFNRDHYEILFMNKLNERGLLLGTHKQEAI